MRALEEVPRLLLPCCHCHLSWKSSSPGHPLALWPHPWGSSPSAPSWRKSSPVLFGMCQLLWSSGLLTVVLTLPEALSALPSLLSPSRGSQCSSITPFPFPSSSKATELFPPCSCPSSHLLLACCSCPKPFAPSWNSCWIFWDFFKVSLHIPCEDLTSAPLLLSSSLLNHLFSSSANP